MKVPLLDLKAQLEEVGDDVRKEVDEVLESCQFINGAKVEALESAVAQYVGAQFGLGVSSGTDALLVALMALDVGPGDVVITTPYSFFATAGSIVRLGAAPAFVDIDLDTFNMSPHALANWFANNQDQLGRVKACIPVHLYGQMADMQAIMELCEAHNVPVVEDAAQAIGASTQMNGVARGAGSLGLIGCFSFFPSKNLGALGDAGMVVTSDADMAEKMRKLKNHGSHPKYYHQLIGGNFRLDAIQAAALLAKFPYLESWHAQRRENAAYYDAAFAEIPEVMTPTLTGSRDAHVYNQYVVRVPRREELRPFLTERGIGTEIYYPLPFHLQECFAYLNYQEGAFPNAETAANETLALPVYPELSRDMQDYVVQTVADFYA